MKNYNKVVESPFTIYNNFDFFILKIQKQLFFFLNFDKFSLRVKNELIKVLLPKSKNQGQNTRINLLIIHKHIKE